MTRVLYKCPKKKVTQNLWALLYFSVELSSRIVKWHDSAQGWGQQTIQFESSNFCHLHVGCVCEVYMAVDCEDCPLLPALCFIQLWHCDFAWGSFTLTSIHGLVTVLDVGLSYSVASRIFISPLIMIHVQILSPTAPYIFCLQPNVF